MKYAGTQFYKEFVFCLFSFIEEIFNVSNYIPEYKQINKYNVKTSSINLSFAVRLQKLPDEALVSNKNKKSKKPLN